MDVRRSPEFAAALLIAEEAFPFDFRVWKHIDAGHQQVDFTEMLSDTTFTLQERLMLEIAASLWSSSAHPTILGVLAERLGDDWLAVLLRALAASRNARVRPRSAAGPV